MKAKICGSLCLFSAAVLLPGAYAETTSDVQQATPHTEELLNVVVVSRHGVRSPTQSAEKLQGWSDKKWPAWAVAAGLLTQRGFYLVKETWALNRARAPFTYGVCPKPEDVQIIADVDERTRKTAQALNEGLYPNCGYQVKVTGASHSAIFSPLKAKVCRIDYPKELEEKLTQKVVGINDRFASEMAEISKLTGHEFNGPMRAKASKYKVGFKGAPYDCSSITEIFALEWGQNPEQKAAWGQLDWNGILRLMPIRVAVFSAINRDMEVARYKGSALANKIIESLDHGPKYTYLIGHDTNLANLGEIFDLNWRLPGRAQNENTPGGYLTFEKWAVNGQPEIRVFYSALSPEQIHAEKVTKATDDFEILPRGTKFEEWKKTYSRRLQSNCIADDKYQR